MDEVNNSVPPPQAPQSSMSEVAPVALQSPNVSYKKKTWFRILLILLATSLLITGAIVYDRYFSKRSAVSTTSQSTPSPTVASSPTVPPDPTADWKTYSNSLYGINIKYPADWVTYNSGKKPNDKPIEDPKLDSVESFFRPTSEDTAAISLQIYTKKSTNESILKKEIEDYAWSNKIQDSIEVDGVQAKRVSGVFTSTQKQNVAVLFTKGNYIYVLQTLGDHSTEFNMMVSTMKFTSSVSSMPTTPPISSSKVTPMP